jgi:hypothetical protein
MCNASTGLGHITCVGHFHVLSTVNLKSEFQVSVLHDGKIERHDETEQFRFLDPFLGDRPARGKFILDAELLCHSFYELLPRRKSDTDRYPAPTNKIALR